MIFSRKNEAFLSLSVLNSRVMFYEGGAGVVIDYARGEGAWNMKGEIRRLLESVGCLHRCSVSISLLVDCRLPVSNIQFTGSKRR